MSTEINLSNKFNGLLVDYLNTFNYLELNVGLCIRHLSDLDTFQADKKLERMAFEKKLKWLLEISSEEVRDDLHEWCKEAHAKRHERNMYMHGQWAFFPHLEKGVEFHIAPWIREKYENVYPGSRFTLKNLENIVLDIKSCFKQLQSLRRKYGI